MRQSLIAMTGIICLAIVVYVRDMTPLPLAISRSQSNSKLSESNPRPLVHKSTQSPIDEPGIAAGRIRIGEGCESVTGLATVLNCLHLNTTRAFESSPRFGVGRGGFGGGQFGQSPNRSEPMIAKEDHQVDRKLASDRDDWLWLFKLHGITNRGFAYQSNGRRVVGMPNGLVSESFVDNLFASQSPREVQSGETIWEVAAVNLVGLLMHDHPVVYDKNLIQASKQSLDRFRDLDSLQAESLEALQDGAELSMLWNRGENHLQALGAIRAKDHCLRCHDVKRGDLLGAFSYRIEESKNPGVD